MRVSYMGKLIVAVMLSSGCWTMAQEGALVQSPAEVQVAQEFQKAAPDLFREWLAVRPEVLKRAALGKPNKPSNQCPGTRYIEFTECKDTVTPNEYTIDVTKTDSVLTPFVGHLYIPVKESCSVKNVIPKGRKGGTPKSIEAMVAGCVNKTYDQCIVAGGKDSPKSFGSVCTGGAAYTFPFEGKLHLTYKWSQGKWEFQEEQGAKPAPPSSAVR